MSSLVEVTGLYSARLAESNISEADAKYAGLSPLSPEGVAKLWRGAPKQAAIVIPYLGPTGKRGEFYRLRLLGKAPGFVLEKPIRYKQPPHSGVRAYLPRTKATNWAEVLSNAETPLLITEGEFKALAATLAGFPTIGLGGVENWRSSRDGVPLLAELAAIDWKERPVYICYDSDIAVKPQVAAAAQRLADKLGELGALVYDAGLPSSTTTKVGLDDFLIASGPVALREHLDDAPPFGSVRALHDFNNRFIFIRSSSKVHELAHDESYEANRFVASVEANAFYTVTVYDKKTEKPKLERRSTASDWIKWPNRRAVQRQDFIPGIDERIIERDGELVLNLWSGWGCLPKRGNVAPFERLFKFLTSELTEREAPSVRRWFLQWLAYPLKNPGAKLYSAVAIWGAEPGTGKTLLGETMLYIYGASGQTVEAEQLENSFNSWAKCKQFILGDEITGSDSRGHADKLKGLITGTTLTINEKFEKPYSLPNTANFYFTSNHPDAFFIDKDRRLVVMETPNETLTREFYNEYRAWLKGEGPSALFAYLLTVDTSDFNPTAPAPTTYAKEVMIDQGKSDVGRFVSLVINDPEQTFSQFGIPVDIDLMTPHELHKFYDPRGEKRATVKAISLELQKQGAVKVLGGRQIHLPNLGHFRFYALRNLLSWKRADAARVRSYVAARKMPTAKF